MNNEAQSMENLRLDYELTNEYFRMLADIRFKLLGFVPTITGVAMTVLAANPGNYTTLALAILGLLVTLGIVIYEVRNTQLYDAAFDRAKGLEVLLGMNLLTKGRSQGGLFNERPRRDLRLFGLLPIWHDFGLALIYGASFAGWSYLTLASFTLLMTPSASWILGIDLAVALITGSLLAIQILRPREANKPKSQ
ncbi:MAG: hypothetical protein M3328_17530 [Chloroflexota bacterium]|nr:hypothetical protein [Chloroflexota bacterium]